MTGTAPRSRKTLAGMRPAQSPAKYCDALVNVELSPQDALTPAKQNTHELLRRDIEYRLLLLDQRLPFWGGARSLTPSIPIQHVRVMDSLLGDVEKQVLEMLDFLAQIEDDADSANRLKAYAEQVRGQFRSASVEETKAEIIRIENRRRSSFSTPAWRILRGNASVWSRRRRCLGKRPSSSPT